MGLAHMEDADKWVHIKLLGWCSQLVHAVIVRPQSRGTSNACISGFQSTSATFDMFGCLTNERSPHEQGRQDEATNDSASDDPRGRRVSVPTVTAVEPEGVVHRFVCLGRDRELSLCHFPIALLLNWSEVRRVRKQMFEGMPLGMAHREAGLEDKPPHPLSARWRCEASIVTVVVTIQDRPQSTCKVDRSVNGRAIFVDRGWIHSIAILMNIPVQVELSQEWIFLFSNIKENCCHQHIVVIECAIAPVILSVVNKMHLCAMLLPVDGMFRWKVNMELLQKVEFA